MLNVKYWWNPNRLLTKVNLKEFTRNSYLILLKLMLFFVLRHSNLLEKEKKHPIKLNTGLKMIQKRQTILEVLVLLRRLVKALAMMISTFVGIAFWRSSL